MGAQSCLISKPWQGTAPLVFLWCPDISQVGRGQGAGLAHRLESRSCWWRS